MINVWFRAKPSITTNRSAAMAGGHQVLQQVRVGGARTTKNGDFSCKRRLQPHQAAAWACRCRLAATGVNVEAERAGGRGSRRDARPSWHRCGCRWASSFGPPRPAAPASLLPAGDVHGARGAVGAVAAADSPQQTAIVAELRSPPHLRPAGTARRPSARPRHPP